MHYRIAQNHTLKKRPPGAFIYLWYPDIPAAAFVAVVNACKRVVNAALFCLALMTWQIIGLPQKFQKELADYGSQIHAGIYQVLM